MSRKKKKRRHSISGNRGRAAGNGELKMSEVILKLAEPLLARYGDTPRRYEAVIILTATVWNKALLPANQHGEVEQEVIDCIVPKDGSAQDVGAIVQAMDIIEERRKQFFPGIRKLIVSYDLQFMDGKARLNVSWTPIPAEGKEAPAVVPPEEKDAGPDQ